MGMMNWLGNQARNLDSSVIGLAERGAKGSVEVADSLIAEELLRRRASVTDGARNAPSLAPEIAELLRARGSTGNVDLEQLKAQNALRAVLAQGGPMPDMGQKAGLDSLRSILEMQGVAPNGGLPTAGPPLTAFANAYADARVAKNPGAGAGFYNALGGISNAVATNPYARVGMYAGATAGGAAGLAAMTPAAQELLALAGFLDNGEEIEEKAQMRLA